MSAGVEERDAAGEQIASAVGDDLNRALWEALVAALTGFLRTARKRLGMRAGERCPRCGHSY